MGFILILVFVAIFVVQRKVYPEYAYKNLKYECFFSVTEAFEGDVITFTEVIENNKFLPVIWLKSTINTPAWLEIAMKSSQTDNDVRSITSSFFLRGYHRVTREWKVNCTKRGVCNISKVSLLCGDFMGSRVVSTAIDTDVELKVYPVGVRDRNIEISSNVFMGDVLTRRWIIDDPFVKAGVREYSWGDKFKDINWNATAKNNTLMVNKNDFSTQISLTVVLNIQSVKNEWTDVINKDNIEYAIKVVAALTELANINGVKISFATNGLVKDERKEIIYTEQKSGDLQTEEILTTLAKLKFKKNHHFGEYINVIPLDKLRDTTVVFVTNYYDEEMIGKLREIKRQGNEAAIIDVSGKSDTSYLNDIKIYSFGYES